MYLLQDISWPVWLTASHIETAIRVTLLTLVGLPMARILGTYVVKLFPKHVTRQASMLFGKGITYGISAILILMVMRELGFSLATLLGAAGVAGVAVGFAAQTSLSNLISGLFLIGEKPFQIGDVLKVGELAGVVDSVDLLSVKIRTFDNKLVRIPNEQLIKTQFTNVTRYPIRRYDIDIGVAYKEDVAKVIKVLSDVADRNPYSLDEPAPIIIFKGFGDSALEFMFGVWFSKSDFLQLRNSIMREIKERFDAEGIEIPFPHRTLYAGSATEPFPVRVIDAKEP